nr:MAG TPA: hypothetical protein [Caudoviricetes sp.]
MSMSSISAYKSSLRIYCITEPSKVVVHVLAN